MINTYREPATIAQALRYAYLLAVSDPSHKIENIRKVRNLYKLSLVDSKALVEAAMTVLAGQKRRDEDNAAFRANSEIEHILGVYNDI